LFENLQVSPKDFYAAAEASLRRREIPGLRTSHVMWSEGGVLGANREYLRVTGEQHTFDMCAAPFGTGFFFSSWAIKREARLVPLFAIVFLVGTVVFQDIVLFLMRIGGSSFVWSYQQLHIWSAIQALPGLEYLLAFLIGAFAVAAFVAIAARGGSMAGELAMLEIPFVGGIYKKVFAPDTYYRIDTLLMFQTAVHAAMLEAIDAQAGQKGVRALTDDERKPVFSALT
jgi:hypothetical protein